MIFGMRSLTTYIHAIWPIVSSPHANPSPISSSPKPQSYFNIVDTWSKHKDFAEIITAQKDIMCKSPNGLFINPMRKLNKEHFLDLKDQQLKARKNLELLQQAYQHHPVWQQCKLEWIKFGDDSTRLFYAKAKQRKLSSYIYTLKDQEGGLVEGFEQGPPGRSINNRFPHRCGSNYSGTKGSLAIRRYKSPKSKSGIEFSL
ncbi:hypothetical protein Cgig2_020955 [Carnegiea gigantea]|uniref:Uncharacterized protein n=1 Tax=Carnegiea gigantea TaxID=171969 RepID=A0A9Q1GPQ9_9CARY|nr:hypothetical protein Cgig2_020955 [Carnegiea gigantea]